MFGILLSALNVVLAFVVRSILVKFIVYFALYFVAVEFMSIISTWLPTGSSLASAFGGIPASIWYFLDLFGVSTGLPMLLAALALRFSIRRIPVVG